MHLCIMLQEGNPLPISLNITVDQGKDADSALDSSYRPSLRTGGEHTQV